MTVRKTMPARRRSETFTMRFGNMNALFAVTIGHYADGSVGEVFISGAKTGSEIEAVTRDGAILLSLAIQHGADLKIVQHALTREGSGKASTIIGAVVDEIIEGEQ